MRCHLYRPLPARLGKRDGLSPSKVHLFQSVSHLNGKSFALHLFTSTHDQSLPEMHLLRLLEIGTILLTDGLNQFCR